MTNNRPKNVDFIVKLSFVVIGVIIIFGIIIGSWAWNLIFDPSHFDINAWANRAIFNTCISLSMMILGFVAFNEGQKAKIEGKFQLRVQAFNDSVNALFESDRIVFFDQFIIWYSAKQLRDKKIKYLTRNGVSILDAQLIVDNATIDDIPVLTGLKPVVKEKIILGKRITQRIIPEPQGRKGEDIVRVNNKGEKVFIPAVNDRLAYYLEQVLDGSISIDVEDSSYYTSINKNKDSNLVSLERAQHTEHDRIKSMRSTFISAAVIGVIFATLFALLAVDLNQGTDTAEAIWNLMARLSTAFIGFISGGFAGLTNVNYLYKYLGDKMKIVLEYNKYYDTNEFVPKTYQQVLEEKLAIISATENEQKSELKLSEETNND